MFFVISFFSNHDWSDSTADLLLFLLLQRFISKNDKFKAEMTNSFINDATLIASSVFSMTIRRCFFWRL